MFKVVKEILWIAVKKKGEKHDQLDIFAQDYTASVLKIQLNIVRFCVDQPVYFIRTSLMK